MPLSWTVAGQGGKKKKFAAMWVLFSSVTLNLICAILLMALLRHMYKRRLLQMNMYMWIIFYLSVMTFFASCNFIPYLFLPPLPHPLDNVDYGCVGFFGTSTAMWSFQIVFTVWITSNSSQNDYKRLQDGSILKLMTFVNLFMSSVIGLAMGLHDAKFAFFIYNWVKVAIASASALTLALLFRKVYSTTTAFNRRSSPLYHLTWKLVWYPIASIIIRLGAIPKNMIMKTTSSHFEDDGLIGDLVLFSFMLLTPMQGVADLLIFCKMKKCWGLLGEMLSCKPTEESKAIGASAWDRFSSLEEHSKKSEGEKRQQFKNRLSSLRESTIDTLERESSADIRVSRTSRSTRSSSVNRKSKSRKSGHNWALGKLPEIDDFDRNTETDTDTDTGRYDSSFYRDSRSDSEIEQDSDYEFYDEELEDYGNMLEDMDEGELFEELAFRNAGEKMERPAPRVEMVNPMT